MSLRKSAQIALVSFVLQAHTSWNQLQGPEITAPKDCLLIDRSANQSRRQMKLQVVLEPKLIEKHLQATADSGGSIGTTQPSLVREHDVQAVDRQSTCTLDRLSTGARPKAGPQIPIDKTIKRP